MLWVFCWSLVGGVGREAWDDGELAALDAAAWTMMGGCWGMSGDCGRPTGLLARAAACNRPNAALLPLKDDGEGRVRPPLGAAGPPAAAAAGWGGWAAG